MWKPLMRYIHANREYKPVCWCHQQIVSGGLMVINATVKRN